MAGVGAMAITLAGLSRTLWGQPQIRYPGAPQVVPYNNGPQGGYQNPGYGGGVPNNGLGGGPSAGDGYPRMAGLPASPVAGGPAAAVDANGNPLGTDGQPVPAEAPAAGVIPMSNVVKVLRDGGPMMFPILICSFILTIFVFERFVSLRRSRVIPRPFVKRFLQRIRENDLDADEAIKLCDANKSPIALVFSAAAKRWDRSTMEVEQAILDEGEQVTNTLRKYSRLFNGISTVCPLMGLLGTVLGMIESFNTIAASSAMGRPELLAGGIGQAMLTTAAGLSVAIPALIVHLYFSGPGRQADHGNRRPRPRPDWANRQRRLGTKSVLRQRPPQTRRVIVASRR